jgi:hypothetical protein
MVAAKKHFLESQVAENDMVHVDKSYEKTVAVYNLAYYA